eukprot:SAG22_NODE_3548_length_1649_cov_3.999355_1_plen_56_part_10
MRACFLQAVLLDPVSAGRPDRVRKLLATGPPFIRPGAAETEAAAAAAAAAPGTPPP